MRIYHHRRNTLDALDATDPTHGIEFDLRSDGNRVIVTHDPFTDGPELDTFLARVGQRPCIFNVKCEGIEAYVLEAAARHGIRDLFLLDLSVPAAVKLARAGEHRFAVRWSEYEPEALARAWVSKARWLWVDCFSAWPADRDAWRRLAEHFSLCLVSPELQGFDGSTITAWRAALGDLPFEAVCTKRPDLWQRVEA